MQHEVLFFHFTVKENTLLGEQNQNSPLKNKQVNNKNGFISNLLASHLTKIYI